MSKTHEVLVVCRKRKATHKFPFEAVKVLKPIPLLERICFGILRRLGWKSNYSFSLSRQLNQLIETFSPDLIHAHFGGAGLTVSDNIANPEVPLLVHFHGVDASAALRNRTYRNRLRRLFNKANTYPLLVSKYMRSRFQDLDLNTQNSHILYYGINVSRFKRTQRLPKQPFIFLQVSSFREKKGHIYTIQAFYRLRQQLPTVPVRLVFLGDGDTLSACKSLADSLGLSDCIEFRGFQDTAAIFNALDTAHCFVHHSITAENGNQEGIPNAIMEAMAMELPIISTYHAGIPELVEDGKHGYLVEEKDVDAYAAKMQDILVWDYLPENQLKIEQQFEQEKHAKKLSEIYTEVAQI
ncbi:MAG: glycosyltransferase [Bacteroidota bacterium]